MDILIIELPNAQDLSAQIRALAAGIVARKTITADESADLRILTVSTRSRLEAIKRGATVAFANTQDGTLRPTSTSQPRTPSPGPKRFSRPLRTAPARLTRWAWR